jgi:hypothetical protein
MSTCWRRDRRTDRTWVPTVARRTSQHRRNACALLGVCGPRSVQRASSRLTPLRHSGRGGGWTETLTAPSPSARALADRPKAESSPAGCAGPAVPRPPDTESRPFALLTRSIRSPSRTSWSPLHEPLDDIRHPLQRRERHEHHSFRRDGAVELLGVDIGRGLFVVPNQMLRRAFERLPALLERLQPENALTARDMLDRGALERPRQPAAGRRRGQNQPRRDR